MFLIRTSANQWRSFVYFSIEEASVIHLVEMRKTMRRNPAENKCNFGTFYVQTAEIRP